DVVVGVGAGQGQGGHDAAAGIVTVPTSTARGHPLVAVQDLELARSVGFDVDVVAVHEGRLVERDRDGGRGRAVVGLVSELQGGQADLAGLDGERGGRGAGEAAAGDDGHDVDAGVAGSVVEQSCAGL